MEATEWRFDLNCNFVPSYQYPKLQKEMKNNLALSILLLFPFLLLAQPEPCGPNPAMTSTCMDACIICDIDGFTGRNDLTVQGQTFQGFCTTQFHNMSYIAFIAGSTDLSIKVTVTNCVINWGLEIGFFESLDCQTFTPITECNTDIPENTSYTFTNDVPLVVGQYYYMIMDGSGGDRCDWTFEVLQGSTAVGQLTTSGVISGEPETCADFPTTYSTTGDVGATIFYWTVDGVTQPTTSQEIDLTFPADGTYELCVTAANACDQAEPTCSTITVHTPQPLYLDETICDGDTIVVAGGALTATGDYEFHITTFNGCDSAIFVTLEVLPQAAEFIDINLCNGEAFYIGPTAYNQPGIFLDTIPTSQDCDSIVTLDLFIIECEIIGATSFTPPVCHGEATGTLVFSVENGTPPFTYDWSNITEPTIGGTGSTVLFTDNEILGVPVGVYEINIMDTFGNDVVLFQEVTEPPELSIGMEAVDLNGFNLSCFGGSDGTALAFPNGGVPPYTYLWDNGPNQGSAANLAAGIYTVNVTDAYGCVRSDSILLTEPSPIDLSVLFTNPNCDGLETGVISLENAVGGTPPYSYALGLGGFSDTTTYAGLGPGSYDFIAMDANGCLFDTVGSLQAPDIPFVELGDDLTVALGCDIVIPTITNGSNITSITWTENGTLSCEDCLKPHALPFNTTSYQVVVTSIDDCTATDSITIHVDKIRDVYFPNAFSPNADGINDSFFIGAGKAVDAIVSMQVFDRWGELVFETHNMPLNDPEAGWGGKFKGEELDGGLFLWTAKISFIDEEVIDYAGDIVLLK